MCVVKFLLADMILIYDNMSKKQEVKKPSLDKATVSKIMRTLPRSEGFHFYKGPGESTEKIAVGLADLAEKARIVDIRSINYHFKRREFEKWVRDNLGDVELSRRISRINKETHGEKLRNEIVILVKARLEELKNM